MQKIIKESSPSRQLFEAVNFAFMKIFDFLVKIALVWASLLFWVIRVTNYGRKSSSVAKSTYVCKLSCYGSLFKSISSFIQISLSILCFPLKMDTAKLCDNVCNAEIFSLDVKK